MGKRHIVRVGIISARELELEVDDPVAVSKSFEKTLAEKDSVLWITDVDGHKFGIAVESIAFVEIQQPLERGVGFGTP